MSRILSNLSTLVLLVALLGAGLVNYGLRAKLERERVGLLSCNEFLADLEASEIIVE